MSPTVILQASISIRVSATRPYLHQLLTSTGTPFQTVINAFCTRDHHHGRAIRPCFRPASRVRCLELQRIGAAGAREAGSCDDKMMTDKGISLLGLLSALVFAKGRW